MVRGVDATNKTQSGGRISRLNKFQTRAQAISNATRAIHERDKRVAAAQRELRSREDAQAAARLARHSGYDPKGSLLSDGEAAALADRRRREAKAAKAARFLAEAERAAALLESDCDGGGGANGDGAASDAATDGSEAATPPAPLHAVRCAAPLPELLTVIVTTSPLPRHPCSRLLDEIVRSVHRHCAGAASCRLLLVADGYVEVRGESAYKRGRVPSDVAAAYESHKQALRAAISAGAAPYRTAELLEQPRHQGFSWSVCRALRAVQTPFVLVVQHDRPLMRDVPIGPLLEAMASLPRLEHVSLPTGRTLQYERQTYAKYAIPLDGSDVAAHGLRFLPLLAFLDSTHFAATHAYLALMRRHRLRRGDFTEDSLGQAQLAEIRTRGLSAHGRYGTWVLDDGDERVMVSHLDGRDSRALDKFAPARPCPIAPPQRQRRAHVGGAARGGEEGSAEEGAARAGSDLCACCACASLREEPLRSGARAVLRLWAVRRAVPGGEEGGEGGGGEEGGKEGGGRTGRGAQGGAPRRFELRVRVCLRTWSREGGGGASGEGACVVCFRHGPHCDTHESKGRG